jgi:hypothetical protein
MHVNFYYTQVITMHREEDVPIRPIEPIIFNPEGMDATIQNSLEYFIYYITHKIENLNALIEAYNDEEDLTRKAVLLESIKATYEAIDSTYPDTIVSQCPDYIKKMHEDLFLDIQRESQAILQPQPSTISPAIDVIAHLPPLQANRMAKILSSGSGANLAQLRSIYTEDSLEKRAFNAFLDACEIRFEAGSNSKNFKLFHKPSQKTFDLKLENRLGAPRSLERELRASDIGGVFVPIYADRQVTYKNDEDQMVTRGLQLSEFCDAGDLMQDAVAHADIRTRMNRVPHIYSQMAAILQGMQDKQAFFRDMKNMNWLIDTKGKVWLADTKSYVHVDEQGVVSNSNIANNYFRNSLSTAFMKPPECIGSQDFLAEPAHVHMLGKDLYQYVMRKGYTSFLYQEEGVPEKDWKVRQDASELEFPREIFETEEGVLLEELIRGMIKKEPGDRITLEEVSNKFDLITSRQLLQELQTYKIDKAAQGRIDELAALLESPEENMHVMSKIKLRLTKYNQSAVTALQDEGKSCNEALVGVMKFKIQRKNRRPVQDRPMIAFETMMAREIKKAVTGKNMVKLTELHQHLDTVKATFDLLKELKQGDKDIFALKSHLNNPEQVQAMHDALEALSSIMKTARDGLEPDVFEALLALLEQTDIKRTMLEEPLKDRATFVKDTFRKALREQRHTSEDFKDKYQGVREKIKKPEASEDESKQQGLDDSSLDNTPQ